MTPELQAAIEQLIGAAQNADVGFNTILDDSRSPDWARRLARPNARALAEAVEKVKHALSGAEGAAMEYGPKEEEAVNG